MSVSSRGRPNHALAARIGWRIAASALLLSFAAPAHLAAQESQSAASDAELAADVCTEGRISSVWVDNHSVFDLTDPNRSERFDWAFRLANRLHISTREDVIRRELVFAEGDCYDPVLLRESERVLRASNFIAEVDIFGVRQPDGSYHVVVDTRDEWSTRVEPRTGPGSGIQLTGISVREDNLLGTGRQASVFYLRSQDSRVYGLSILDPQLFATRWQGGVAAGRTPVGSFFRETLEYPFVGETGRRAFRHHLGHHDRYFGYLVTHGDSLVEVLMPERRRSFDLGAATRFGERGRLTLLGAMLAGEWVSYPKEPRLARNDAALVGASRDTLFQPLSAALDSVADVRAIVLVGQRNVYFVRRRGFDTVRGTEDIRLGLEVELGLGRSIRSLSSGDDLSLDLGLFAAGQLGSAGLLGTRFVAEGKRDYRAPSELPEWDDVFAQWDIWAYWRPGAESRHTFVGMVAGSGGWNPRVPFQLTLGGTTGLRGQPDHLAPGSQRVIASLEARSFLGWPYPQLFDLGSVVFVDAGRIWAGDAAYGQSSRVHANLGVGLRGAFPPGSHNTFRLDIAAPLAAGLSLADVVFSVGVGQAIGRQPRYDPQLVRSSRRGTSTSLFSVRTDREP
jgi:hypothetical protein